MKRNNKKGFTIVELVIVIAVIAILSAVLIPTFGGVIDQANAAADLQKARNAYTEYLTTVDIKTNGVPEIDYVLVNGKYYEINNDYEAVEELDACAVVLSENNGTWSHAVDHTAGTCTTCNPPANPNP
ncbi:MAG: type II secretion system protein [Clostridia bacterium]|nr:type II secretion system protein [Clostridia bacterium]